MSKDISNLQYIAYHQSFGPMDAESLTIKEFSNSCKSFLCAKKHILWKDPIWDTYKEEEIIIEYFSYLFLENEAFRENYKNSMGNSYDDACAWFDQAIEQNRIELMKLAPKEDLSFSEKGLGDD